MGSNPPGEAKIKSPAKPIPCPKCKDKKTIKSGTIQGQQRWKCKACDYQYTRIQKRGRPLWQKSLVVFLYSYGVSMHQIARIFDVQPSTILKWVRIYANDYAHTPESGEVKIMELCEMHSRMQENIGQNNSTLLIAIDDAIFKSATGITISRKKG